MYGHLHMRKTTIRSGTGSIRSLQDAHLPRAWELMYYAETDVRGRSQLGVGNRHIDTPSPIGWMQLCTASLSRATYDIDAPDLCRIGSRSFYGQDLKPENVCCHLGAKLASPSKRHTHLGHTAARTQKCPLVAAILNSLYHCGGRRKRISRRRSRPSQR